MYNRKRKYREHGWQWLTAANCHSIIYRYCRLRFSRRRYAHASNCLPAAVRYGTLRDRSRFRTSRADYRSNRRVIIVACHPRGIPVSPTRSRSRRSSVRVTRCMYRSKDRCQVRIYRCSLSLALGCVSPRKLRCPMSL